MDDGSVSQNKIGCALERRPSFAGLLIAAQLHAAMPRDAGSDEAMTASLDGLRALRTSFRARSWQSYPDAFDLVGFRRGDAERDR